MKIENNEKYEKVKIGETESGGKKLSNQKDVTIGEMGCERGNQAALLMLEMRSFVLKMNSSLASK